MKMFFLEKEHLVFIIISNLPNVQNFLFFLPDKPHNEGWKHIFRKYYHIIRILQQIYYFSDFKKFNFFRKTHLLFEKPQLLSVLRIFLISVAFYGKFATIWWKKLTFKHVNNRCWLVYASSIGKHRVKKRTYLRGRFCFPYSQYGAKLKTTWRNKEAISNLMVQKFIPRTKKASENCWGAICSVTCLYIYPISPVRKTWWKLKEKYFSIKRVPSLKPLPSQHIFLISKEVQLKNFGFLKCLSPMAL